VIITRTRLNRDVVRAVDNIIADKTTNDYFNINAHDFIFQSYLHAVCLPTTMQISRLKFTIDFFYMIKIAKRSVINYDLTDCVVLLLYTTSFKGKKILTETA
jgi:hypothetical protein